MAFKKSSLLVTALSAAVFYAIQAHAATVVINGGNSVVAADPAATPAINFLTDHTADVSGGINVTGAVQNSSGTDGLGILELSGTNTVTGNIGATGARLKQVNVTGTGVTINGDVYVSEFAGLYHSGAHTTSLNGNLYGNSDIGNGATLNLGSGYTITGLVWSGIGGAGTLNIDGDMEWTSSSAATATSNINSVNFNNDGNVTLGVNLDADNIRLRNTTTTTLSANITMKARSAGSNTALAVQNTASLDVADKDLAVNGTVSFAAGTTFSAQTSGQIRSTGTATVNADTNLVVSLPGISSLASGQSITLIDGTGGAGVATLNAGKITDTSAVFSFAQNTATTEDLVVTATRAASYNSAAGITDSQQPYNAGTVLNGLAAGGTSSGDMALVTGMLDSYNAAQLNEELNRVASGTAATVVMPVFQVSAMSTNTVLDRLSALQSGVSSGDAAAGHAFWARGFGAHTQQDQKGGFDGYTAKTGGMTLGADHEFGAVRAGLAYSYSQTTVDLRDTRPDDSTDIESHRIALYGTTDFGQAYVDAQLGFSFHDYQGTRQTALGRVANASYNGYEMSAMIGGGYRYALDASLFLTPYASLAWDSLHQGSYTETDAGALNLRVEGNDTDRLQSGLGLRLSGTAKLDKAVVKPEIHAAWKYDILDVSTDTTARFSGGGASFVTPGQDINRSAYNAGAGVSFMASDAVEVRAAYDYEGRSGYDSHNLQLTARWAF